ncbi:MAG: aspartyl beta-hydroxylase [Proteobacteria bacterium]|nr:aspartyl beta-hydroxylase [Pseudomonadota bacterium]
MQYFHKISENEPVASLLAAVMRQPELWNQNLLRTTHEGTPHSEVSDIWLRFNDLSEYKKTNERSTILDQHESIDYPAFAMLPQARQIIFNLMRFVEGKRLGRVLITKLEPSKKIYPHVDSGDHAAYYDRYHVVLKNSEGSIFRAGNEVLCMKAGDIYWFDNSAEHEVINNSYDDRIVMIVDIRSK